MLAFFGIPFSPAPPYAETVGAAKGKNDGTGVYLSGQIVTRLVTQNPGSVPVFYVEQPDRSSGIKVEKPFWFSPSEGDALIVSGIIQTISGERVVSPLDVVKTGTGPIPGPVYVGSKSVGGGTQPPQGGITGGIGLNDIGLLVAVAGSLTQGTSFDANGNTYFIIDDGGGVKIGSQAVPGIKVIGYTPTETLGSMLRATGVIGAELDVDGTTVIPVIRMRDFEYAEQIQ